MPASPPISESAPTETWFSGGPELPRQTRNLRSDPSAWCRFGG